MDPNNVSKLPNGYADLVKEAKNGLKSVVVHINNSVTQNDIDAKISALSKFGTITGKYYDKDCLHVDFDFNHRIIGIGAYVDILPNVKMVIGKTCTVFLDKIGSNGNPLFKDNYKW